MKTLFLEFLSICCLTVVSFSVSSEILLMSESSINTMESVDVVEDGFLAPRDYVWIPYVTGAVAVHSRKPLPFTSVPPVTAPSVGGMINIPATLFFAPTATLSPELSRLIQSGHAWSIYQTGDNTTGIGLVYSPSYGVQSNSQRSARGNRSRAQAFRLDYYR